MENYCFFSEEIGQNLKIYLSREKVKQTEQKKNVFRFTCV